MTLAQLLTTRQVAELLQISEGCVRNWRSEQYGPPFVRVGRMIRYKTADVEEWLAREIPGIAADVKRLQKDAAYWTNVQEKADAAHDTLKKRCHA
jgi:excisionase family DNA binding protein